MKNPFLEDRNIFSKVQKPTIKTNTIQRDGIESESKPDAIKNYTGTQFYDKPGQKTTNFGQSSTGYSSGYQPRQIQKLPPPNTYTQPMANTKFSTQKITFGDPSSSEAYQGQRTSGYFNIQNHVQKNQPIEYKYEPKLNNYTGTEKSPYVKNSFALDPDIKNTNRQQQRFDKPYGNQLVQSKIGDYEFAPPPINNFSNDYQITDSKHGYKQTGPYEFKSTYQTNQQLQQQQLQPSYSNKQYEDKFSTQNIYSSQKNQSIKSPPKLNQPPFTPKNDISYQFKQNNYGNFSPIGEASQHKIEDDSLMNLDGLMENVEFDKLFAESKTQQELLKILGMDTQIIKKNQYQEQKIKNITPQNTRSYQYQQKTSQQTVYLNQRQNQFSKKVYQQQSRTQNKIYQNQTYKQQPSKNKQIFIKDSQEPQVINYGQNYPSSQIQTRSKPHINNKAKETDVFTLPNSKQPSRLTNTNEPYYKQIYVKTDNIDNQSKEQHQEDLETMINKEMEKFILQKQGPLQGKRIFMTASEKIVTKKYNLPPL